MWLIKFLFVHGFYIFFYSGIAMPKCVVLLENGYIKYANLLLILVYSPLFLSLLYLIIMNSYFSLFKKRIKRNTDLYIMFLMFFSVFIAIFTPFIPI